MLRLGSAICDGAPIVIAQSVGNPCYVNVSDVIRDIAPVATLDDLLALNDGKLETCLNLIRQGVSSAVIQATRLRLTAPLLKPARIRDCGIITTHLRPAFNMMIARLETLEGVDTARAIDALKARLYGTHERRLSWGERDVGTISGPSDPIPNPGGELDFELEMAVVVRRCNSGAPHIFGYTLYNDWTLRDRQIAHFAETLSLHGPAKNFPASNSFGPMVVLAADFDPAQEVLRVEVNGEVHAEGTLEHADWSFDEAVAEIYRAEPIAGTELLGSGTVFGGSMFERGLQLLPGSQVVLSSPAIGALANLGGAPQ